MATITKFEEIEAWKTGREVARLVYVLTDKGSFGRDFALRDQMRRAAVSVISNIAEGFESRTRRLFVEFLGRAKGYAGEVRAQAYIALDAGHINVSEFEELVAAASKCSRQIAGFVLYLDGLPSRGATPDKSAERQKKVSLSS